MICNKKNHADDDSQNGYLQGWLETHISYTWLWERHPWGWVRLSDWVEETHCVVKAEWKCIFIWFYDFLFCFVNCVFLLLFYLLCLQNHQLMVTSFGRCCWSGRRALIAEAPATFGERWGSVGSSNWILTVPGSNCNNAKLFIAISTTIFKTRISWMRKRIQKIRQIA